MLSAGNAGGVIATLSLIGVTASRATPPGFPGEYLVLLIVFLVGVLGALFIAGGEHFMAGWRWKAAAPPLIHFTPSDKSSAEPKAAAVFRGAHLVARAGGITATLCLLIGSVGGIVVLARLARW